MNKNAVYLAIFAVLCVTAGTLFGVTISYRMGPPMPFPGRHGFMERAERFMGRQPGCPGEAPGGRSFSKMLARRLELNKEQEIKIKEILENTRREIDKVGMGVRETIAGIKEKTDKQIMGILNPEQQEKFRELIAEMSKKFPMHGGPDRERGPMNEEGPRPGEDLPR